MNLFDPQHSSAVAVTCALEQLPHVVKRVCFLWGQPEFEAYVNSLVMDARDGKRQGLPWEAAQDLLFLAELDMAKRALSAAELTGVPFETMFAKLVDAASQHSSIGVAAPAGDCWADPRVSKDTSRERGAAIKSPNKSRSGTAASASWWQRIFSTG